MTFLVNGATTMWMATDKLVLRVVEDLRRKCDAGLERINAFVRWHRQVEGWFKGELLTTAAQMLDNGEVREFHSAGHNSPLAGSEATLSRYSRQQAASLI